LITIEYSSFRNAGHRTGSFPQNKRKSGGFFPWRVWENEGEFIKKKTLYENKVLRLAELNGSMDELEREMDENRIYIEKIKTLMLDRLGTCGI